LTSEAKWGKGTTLSRNANLIAQITNIGGIEVTQEAMDATNYDSPDDYREKIFGLLDAGNVTIEGDFKPGDTDGQIGLITDMEAHTVQTFVLTLPAAFATAWTFTAGVSKFAVRPPMNGKVTFGAELAISGKPTLGITVSNDLSDLDCTTGTFQPTFAAATKSYVVTTTGASVTFTATFDAGVATLKVNGASPQTLTSTVPSSAINCGAVGAVTTITIEVVETGKTAITYTCYLTKTA